MLTQYFIQFIRSIAYTLDRVAFALVVRLEIEVHSPARTQPIRISTGIVLKGTLFVVCALIEIANGSVCTDVALALAKR